MLVGDKFRMLRARLTLLVVDDDGMSTVEYANVNDYTFGLGYRCRCGGRSLTTGSVEQC